MSLEWRTPHYNTGDGEVWNLHSLDNMHWSILGTIVYLGLTRRANWAERVQRWRLDTYPYRSDRDSQLIEAKTMEEAKAAALAILVLS